MTSAMRMHMATALLAHRPLLHTGTPHCLQYYLLLCAARLLPARNVHSTASLPCTPPGLHWRNSRDAAAMQRPWDPFPDISLENSLPLMPADIATVHMYDQGAQPLLSPDHPPGACCLRSSGWLIALRHRREQRPQAFSLPESALVACSLSLSR